MACLICHCRRRAAAGKRSKAHSSRKTKKSRKKSRIGGGDLQRYIGLCYKLLGQYGKAVEVYEELALIDATAIELYEQALRGVANEGVEPRLRP